MSQRLNSAIVHLRTAARTAKEELGQIEWGSFGDPVVNQLLMIWSMTVITTEESLDRLEAEAALRDKDRADKWPREPEEARA